MAKKSLFFILFYFLSIHFLSYGQTDSISEWQEQILNNIDADEFSDVSYARFLELLSDLELHRFDTIYPQRVSQNIVLRSDLCLNIREGYHDVTSEKIAKNKSYLGDAFNHTLRYNIKIGQNWSGAMVFNKDAGERFRKRVPWFDSYSAYVRYRKGEGVLRDMIVGNYRVRFGSGLVINQQFSLGKNLLSENFMLNGTAISGHSSNDEYNYMQGVALEIRPNPNLQIIPFVSFKRIDAVVKNDTITSIPEDGYHRTMNEAAKRHQASVFNTGLHASLFGQWYEIGASLLYTRFSHPYSPPQRKYNIYYYRGQQLLQGSFDYHLRRYGFEMRGETAFDNKFNIATIGVVKHAIGEDWNGGILYRAYMQKYAQKYASSVAESSAMQGERGAMFFVEGTPFPYWQFKLMYDYFHLTNVTYGFDTPIRGMELRTQARFLCKGTEASVSYRMKLKKDIRHSLDGNFSYTLHDGIKFKTQLRSRIFSSKEKGGYSFGYAIAQGIILNKEEFPLSGEIQATWFDTDDYDTRVYISERNVLYGFGIPRLSDRGLRCSLTGSYKIRPSIALDLKYCWIHYTDADHISSGLQQIWGKNQYNLWVQLHLKI